MLSLYRFTGLLATIILPFLLSAQCGLTVDAGADEYLCTAQGEVQLVGDVSGVNLLGFRWSPEAGLSDPSSISPIATVTGPITYTLTATQFDPTANLIQNGDFNAGPQGFTTQYTLGTGGPFGLVSDEGTYQVANNPRNTHTNFASCGDHTSGSGNMLIVNGATFSNEAIWCQTVTVNPGYDYAFSAWLSSVISQNPARLQFSVNGTLLGNSFRASRTVCEWLEFTEVWNAGTATSAEICIVNQNTGLAGNDFAIDDLFFGEICTQSDEITIQPVSLVAAANRLSDLSCTTPTTRLTSDGSSNGTDIGYTWSTTNGSITGGANTAQATVAEPGNYVLLVSHLPSGCTAMAGTTVSADITAPVIDIIPPGTLDCKADSLVLNASNSSTNSNITISWTTPDGDITTGANTLQPTIAAPGSYTLSLANTFNGCATAQTVVVNQVISPLAVTIAPPDTLNCRRNSVVLSGRASNGVDYTYEWFTPDGNLLAGQNQSSTTVSSGGQYFLRVTDGMTECSSRDTVIVAVDTISPTAEAGDSLLLNCLQDTLALNSSGSTQGASITYQWRTEEGNLINSAILPAPEIDAGGNYHLRVTNQVNGCSSEDSVWVATDFIEPMVFLGPVFQELTCRDSIILLNEGAFDDPNYYYQWANGGTTLAIDTFPMLSVSNPGAYGLVVTDKTNGCFGADLVVVNDNRQLPNVSINLPEALNCERRTQELDATTSDGGSGFTALWTTNDGTILRGANSLNPLINSGGTYQLEIINEGNGCRETAMIAVFQDTTLAVVSIPPAPILDCERTEVELVPLIIGPGTNYRYQWRTEEGTFIGASTGTNARVNAPGIYRLEVLNEDNRCSSFAEINVIQDAVPPALFTQPTPDLNCIETRRQIVVSTPPAEGELSISWTTSDGQIVSGENSLRPTIDLPGTYRLVVRNRETNCSNEIEVMVGQNILPPQLELPDSLGLGCTTAPQALTATATGQGAMAYSWTTSDGSLLEGSNTPTPLVGAPGNYRLSVIDATNGCTAEASLFAFQNLLDSFAFTFVAPDCRVPTGSLRFTEVVGGTAPFVYSFDGGRSFANATEAEGLSPGRYNLRIQDLNGCELTQEAIIPNPPELELMLGNRVVLPLGEGFQIRPQTNFSTEQLEVINWTPAVTLDCADCLQPLATPTESTLYTLNLISTDGCTATDSLEVIVTKRRDIYFPTAFSPNGDGRNDRFLPLGDTKLIAVINDFNIHDRWGNTLFAVPELQPNDPIGGWDGRHRGRLVNPATFVYSAKVTFIDGVQQVFEGSFTLLR